MKRDRKLQYSILKRIGAAESACLNYEYSNATDEESNIGDTPDWSDEEAFNIDLMLKEGLLSIDVPPRRMFEPSETLTYIRTTNVGYNFVENFSLWKKALNNISRNIPTILVSIVGSLLLSWAIYYVGPPNK